MSKPSVIAIDGPAASGKSTIGLMLAKELGYLFFDTGVMYRIAALCAIKEGIEITDQEKVERLAGQVEIKIARPSVDDGRVNDILMNGSDVTWEIRSAEVNNSVSVVSAYPGVRQAMTEQQRLIAKPGKIVMVGRDIGTVVVPKADCKIFLDASAEERARRRYVEETERGLASNYEKVLASIQERDRIDSTRAIAPLVPADDAFILNSDHKSIDEVLAEMKAIVQNCCRRDAHV